MADLIERSAITNSINDFLGQYAVSDDALYAFSLCSGIINNVPAVNRWIPCEERMPEQDTMVIVCYYGSDCIMPMQGETVTEAMARQNKVPTVTMGFLSEEGWNGADFFPMMVQPAFWMPLPDPPERSEEG